MGIPLQIEGSIEFSGILIKRVTTELGEMILLSEKYEIMKVKQLGKKRILNVRIKPRQILIPVFENPIEYLERIVKDRKNSIRVRGFAKVGLKVLKNIGG